MDTIAIIIAVNNEESKNRIEQLFNSVKAVEYCNIELYFINKNGELYTDFGQKKLKETIKNGYVKNGLILKDGS